jgi:hypothetical protein
MGSNSCTNVAAGQVCLDFSPQIVRPQNLSVEVQGLYAPHEGSSIQIRLQDYQYTRYLLAWHCYVRKHKIN